MHGRSRSRDERRKASGWAKSRGKPPMFVATRSRSLARRGRAGRAQKERRAFLVRRRDKGGSGAALGACRPLLAAPLRRSAAGSATQRETSLFPVGVRSLSPGSRLVAQTRPECRRCRAAAAPNQVLRSLQTAAVVEKREPIRRDVQVCGIWLGTSAWRELVVVTNVERTH